MSRKKNVFLNGLGMGLVVISSVALADTVTLAEASAPPEFSAIDKNADGSVNIAEAKEVKGLAEIFGKLDANADGKLTQNEYTEGLKKLPPAGS